MEPPIIVGTHPRIQAVRRQIERVAPSDTTVLILGESGTGKELVARSLHALSARSAAPFVAVNCAAFPEGLLESELFGHEEGAFTGATRPRAGRFEEASAGTLLLDEIGEIPASLQVKLLRVLQERTYERLGSSTPRSFTGRIVAATNRQLHREVEAGTFREDLYYRLAVFEIEVAPLRMRVSDIPQLARNQLAALGGGELTPTAVAALLDYPWPGNVRELHNALERARVMAGGGRIDLAHLPERIRGEAPSPSPRRGTMLEALDELERAMVVEALAEHEGRRAPAARMLGITERKLGIRITKHGIDAKRFRPGVDRQSDRSRRPSDRS